MEWYCKAVDTPSCPLCRHELCFKGMHKIKLEMDNTRYENRCDDVFAEQFDGLFEECLDEQEEFAEYGMEFDGEYFMDELKLLQRRMKYMIDQGGDTWEIEDVLNGEVDQYRYKDFYDPAPLCDFSLSIPVTWGDLGR